MRAYLAAIERAILAKPSRIADHLGDVPRTPPHDPRVTWLLGGLVLLCLIPRLLMLWRLGSVCNDAYYYIYVADALQKGNLQTAFAYLNLNIYPVILLLLNNLGLDWEVAGKLWGALTSSLLVLPMFGWVRRLFDDRVAAATCFLYAVHPNLIEVSVEPLREATCWFLFTLCMYLSWRAITENRLWLYVLAGITLCLGLHTRVECWFLLAPIVQWFAFRWWHVDRGRVRMAVGLTLCLAVTPVLLVAVNVTMLRDHERWEFGRLSHFRMVGDWLSSGVLPSTRTAGRSESPPASDGDVPGEREATAAALPKPNASPPAAKSSASRQMRAKDVLADPPELPAFSGPSTSERLQTYLKALLQTLEAANVALMLIGLARWRHLIRHRDKSVLIMLCGVILLAIWIRLTQLESMNGRYFLMIFFIGAPFQALGLLYVLRRVALFGRRFAPVKVVTAAPAAVAAVLIATTGWADALTTQHIQRDSHVAFGRWLQVHCGHFDSVVADLGSTRAGYYAMGTLPQIVPPYQLFNEAYDRRPPDLIIFSTSYIRPENRAVILERAEQLGLIRIAPRDLPHTRDAFIVMMKREPAGRLARQANGTGIDGRRR